MLREVDEESVFATDSTFCSASYAGLLNPTDEPESLGRFGRYEIREILDTSR